LEKINAFSISGVDYGGPFALKMGKIRNAKILNGYICLFVCFATRALHLELVSELSSDCFLAALRRFIARRGGVSEIHSDNGTNFVGAQRKMATLREVSSSADFNNRADRYLGDRGIAWKFIPPGSPHMGGLWEAGVKSVKRHLAASLGDQVLTYEEFYTVLVQIEAVLNSRPITPVSSDPTDFEALTPGHFLLQEPMYMLPEEFEHGQGGLGKRWSLLQQILGTFWRRWQSDYLITLQRRGKWTTKGGNIKEGDLVILKDPSRSPCRWRLGRISHCFPGTDDLVRVVEVKTKQGVYRRSIKDLCPLPMNDS
jgi:hypothetical protein